MILRCIRTHERIALIVHQFGTQCKSTHHRLYLFYSSYVHQTDSHTNEFLRLCADRFKWCVNENHFHCHTIHLSRASPFLVLSLTQHTVKFRLHHTISRQMWVFLSIRRQYPFDADVSLFYSRSLGLTSRFCTHISHEWDRRNEYSKSVFTVNRIVCSVHLHILNDTVNSLGDSFIVDDFPPIHEIHFFFLNFQSF